MTCVTLEMSLEMFQLCSSFYSDNTFRRKIESPSCNLKCSDPLSVFTVHHSFHCLESWGGKCCIASHCFLPSPPNPRTDFCFLLQSQIPQLQRVFCLKCVFCPRYIGHARNIGTSNVEPKCHKWSEREEGWNVFTNNSMAWVIENAKGWKKKKEEGRGEFWWLVSKICQTVFQQQGDKTLS